MPSPKPASVLPDAPDRYATAFVAALAPVVVLEAYSFINALGSTPAHHLTVFDMLGVLVISTFFYGPFVVAYSWLMTVVLGLPVVMVWIRLRGGISGFTTAVIGAVLGGGPVLLAFARHGLPPLLPLLLFTACGLSAALSCWWIALRTPS
jgi:hypothetical protein